MKKKAYKQVRKIGFDLPNVFNSSDLSMGENWMVLEEEKNGKSQLIPIVGFDGERLNYQKRDILFFTNHNSDFLYFGTTLLFRRRIIGMNKKEVLNLMKKKNFGWKNLERRIKYDYYKRELTEERTYRVQIFNDNSNKINLWSNSESIYNKTLLFEQNYTYSTENGLSLFSNNISK